MKYARVVLACDLAVCTEGTTFLPAWMAIGIANDAGTSFTCPGSSATAARWSGC